MQTKKIVEIIEVEEIYTIIEQGFTMPVKCRLKNGMNVIVKYMRNPAGSQVLINEWIGSNIADIIGLTIPEYGICDLTEEVIKNTNCNEEIDIRNTGLAFYTKEYAKAIPAVSKGVLRNVINREVEKIILFDHLVNNNDRHNGNLLCDISTKPRLYVIDNSHIITSEPNIPFIFDNSMSESEILSDRIIKNNRDVYDLLSSTIGYDEDVLVHYAKEIKGLLTVEEIDKIRYSIPFSWQESVGKEKINQLFEVLKKRISFIDDIVEVIIGGRKL